MCDQSPQTMYKCENLKNVIYSTENVRTNKKIDDWSIFKHEAVEKVRQKTF